MKLLSFIAFDLRNGLIRNWWKYAITFVIALLLCLAFYQEYLGIQETYLTLYKEYVSAHDNYPLYTDVPSLIDYLTNFVDGIPRYTFNSNKAFPFPASWYLVFFLLIYTTLHYPYRDLMGMGKQLLVAGQSRWVWWLSKCVWVVISVLAFFGVAALGAFVWTLISGGSLGGGLTPLGVSMLGGGNIDFPSSELPTQVMVGGAFYAGVVVAIALCLVQMLISLVIRPLLSFLITITYLFFSAYFEYAALLGNYLMAARSSYLSSDGMDALVGLESALVLGVLAIVAGGIIFSHQDIYDKEH